MSRAYDAICQRVVETIESVHETVLRVNADSLVFASAASVAVRLTADEKSAETVTLTVQMFRSEVLKLVKLQVLGSMTIMDLTSYDALVPIEIIFEGKIDLIEGLNHALSEGRPLDSCLTATDADVFPAFTDLANYRFVRLMQTRTA